jgi:hypothetical protein
MKATQFASRVLLAATLVAATTSCGKVVRSSSAPVLLVIDQLNGLRGSSSTSTAASSLVSDVFTLVTSGGSCTTASPCPTIFADNGQVVLHMVPKDIGTSSTTPASPSTNNEVTIQRIHVAFTRSDGRNQEGVDVPYAFDTVATGTVPQSGQLTLNFPLVRVQAKQEPPLMALRTNGQVLSMIGNITFYGQDLVGNAISVSGSIAIDFANWGDQ